MGKQFLNVTLVSFIFKDYVSSKNLSSFHKKKMKFFFFEALDYKHVSGFYISDFTETKLLSLELHTKMRVKMQYDYVFSVSMERDPSDN